MKTSVTPLTNNYSMCINFQFNFLQAAAYASSDGVLTEAMIDERVDDYARQHAQKVRKKSHQIHEPHSGYVTYPLSFGLALSLSPASSRYNG